MAVDGSNRGEALIRAGWQMAGRQDAPWTVVTVDNGRKGSDERKRLDRALDLASRLGARVRGFAVTTWQKKSWHSQKPTVSPH